MMEYLYTSTYTHHPHPPTFSLPLHTQLYILSSKFQIHGLQTLSCTLFTHHLNNHVSNLEVYFTSVRSIYAHTSPENPGLRIAVVEAAVSEMRKLLGDDDVRNRFFEVMTDTPDFMTDVMTLLVEHPERPVLMQELCEECGPRGEGEGYEVTVSCKTCGKDRTVEFC
jgi:hypothetical protein